MKLVICSSIRFVLFISYRLLTIYLVRTEKKFIYSFRWKKKIRRLKLTFCTVLPLPSGIAHNLPALSTCEVSEGVVSGPAEHRAAVAVVVFIAHETVGELELRPTHSVQVLGPLLSHCQMPLGGHGADHPLWVLWNVHDEAKKINKWIK